MKKEDIMDFLKFLLFSVPVLALSILEVSALYSGMECLLNKQRGAGDYFLLWLVVLLFEVLLYSWLPLRFGIAVELFEDLIVLEGGAVVANLGWMLAAQAIMLGLSLLKHVWGAIRKQVRFHGKLVLLEAVLIALFAYFSAKLVHVTETVPELGRTAAMWVVLLGLALLALLLFRKLQRQGSLRAQEDSDGEKLLRLIQDCERLAAAGDYQAQLSLLEQADQLKLSGENRAMVQVFRALAYERLGNLQAAEASYQAALQADQWNSNALTNLANLAARRGDFAAADRYINTALQHEKNKQNKGHIYANYASICIQRGDREKAKRFVEAAARCGISETELQKHRRALGI